MSALADRALRAARLTLQRRETSIERCGQLLSALSHRGVLARGFALVRDLDGRPLRDTEAVLARHRIDIELCDGRVRALVEGKTAGTSPPVRPRRRRSGNEEPGQGSLFG